MRALNFPRGAVALLILAACAGVCGAQGVSADATPFVNQVTPPSRIYSATADTGNFTLTIYGANFTPNATVSVATPSGYALHPSTTTVNATGSQIFAQFTNAFVGATTLAVTVTNPSGAQPTTSNPFYVPYTSGEPNVVLSQSVTALTNGNPLGIIAAPLTNSNYLDIATVSQNSNQVNLTASNFTGAFSAGPSYATGNGPYGIVAADFFNSGQLGMAITNSLDNTVSILLPNGGGTFRAGNLVTLPGVFPTQILAGDFNGDGKIDLAVLNTCGTGANGCFPQAAPQGPGSVTILLGDGAGDFTPTSAVLTTGNIPFAMVAGDFNGDGILDLAVANSGSNTVTLFLGNGDGTFTPASNSAATGNVPSGLAVGDFNGDGQLDLAVTNAADNTVSILLNQNCAGGAATACSFAPTAAATAVGGGPSAIATGDLNADGHMDLVVANTAGNSVTILLGDGTGNFSAATPHTGTPSFATGASPQGVVLGDFNQDGRLDIVTTNSAQGGYTYLQQAAAPQLTMGVSAATVSYGQFVSYTVSFAPPGPLPIPNSTVTFYDGTTAMGSVPITGYQVQFYSASLNVGVHQVTAVFNGDSTYYPATTAPATVTVTKATTATTLSANVTSVPYGQPFTLTAKVTFNGTNPTTGTVTFFDATTSADLGDIAPNNNIAQLTLSNLSGGAHTIVATYNGDNNFNGSTSSNLTETILPASTSITVAGSPNPSVLGQSVTFTGTVQPGAGNSATGAVEFLANGVPIGVGTVSNNTAHFATSALAVGTAAITAQYSGDSNFATSTSNPVPQTVTPGPATASLSLNNYSPTYGQPQTATATVQGLPGVAVPTGTVTFLDGANILRLATLTSGTAQFALPVLASGPHTLTAKYGGDANYQTATSNAANETILLASVNANLTASANPASYSQPVTLTAALQLPYGGTASGNVTFTDSGVLLGTAPATSNAATLVVSTLALGTHNITATYQGDVNTSGGNAGHVTLTVNPTATTTTLASSVNPSIYGQSTTFTATVKAAFGTLPSGTISYYDGTTLLGTFNTAAGPTTLTTQLLVGGTHNITAQFATTNGNFTGSTSSALTQTVNPANTTLSFYSATNPSAYGQAITITVIVSSTYNYTSSGGTVTLFDAGTQIGTGILNGNSVSFPNSTFLAGAHSLTATYGGDSNLNPSTSAVFTQTVNQEATTTTIASSSYAPAYQQAITLSSTVRPASGTAATGTITFLDGTKSLGSAPVSGNAAQLSGISTLSPGTHSISAQYSGDANTAGSTSGQTQVVVSPPPTTTILTANPNPVALGQPVTLTATLQLTSSGTPTGTVTFSSGSYVYGTATVSGGVAQFVDSGFQQTGTQSITATYSGDANFNGSTSAVLNLPVNPGPTVLTVSGNPGTRGYPVTINVGATATYGGTPTGLVTLYDGSTSIGSGYLSGTQGNDVAAITVTGLAAGTHSLTASYAGSASFAPSTSAVYSEVINLPTTATSIQVSPSSTTYGHAVMMSATVTSIATGTPTGSVTFNYGSTVLGTGTLSGGAAQISVSTLPVGTDVVTATYSGDSNFTGSTTSPGWTVTVSQASTTTTVTSAANPASYGQSVTFTVSVASSGGGTPTGTVSLLDGGTAVGSGTLVSGAVQISVSNFAPGAHTMTAVYSGDTGDATSTSAALTETVNIAATTTTLTSSANPSTFGQAVTFTATVQPPAGLTAPGTVTFYNGSTAIGTATLTNNAAQLTVSTLTVGTEAITATYGGNGNFSGSTSAALVQSVSQAVTTTTVSSNANPAVSGQAVTFTATVQVPAGVTPSGNVTFSDESQQLGTVALSGNSAQFSISTLPGGAHTITAMYDGTASLAISTSSALTETITQSATSISFTTSPNPATFGQAVRFVSTVQPVSPSGGLVTGTVTFYDGSTVLTTSPIVNNGSQYNQSGLTYSGFSGGKHSITATYSGDASNAGSTSAVTVLTVSPAASAVAVTSNLNPATFGQSVTFTATVTPSISGDFATGSVMFLDGGTLLGTVGITSSDTVSLAVGNLAAGTHTITARYSGDANFATSTSAALSQSVTQGSTATSVASSLNPSVYAEAVTFTATITPANGASATGTVTFLDGGASIGTASVTGNVAQLTLTGLARATHSITASYAGNANLAGSTSSALTQTVNQASTATTLSASANPATYGQAVTLTATIAPAFGGAATGTVTFYNGSIQLRTGSVSGNLAQYTTSATALSVGSHSLTAKYGGDTNFVTSTSAVLTETVNAAASTTVVTSSGNPTLVGSSVTFTASVSSTTSGTQSGSVKFYLDGSGTASATVTLSGGTATYKSSSLAAGTHSVVAVFTSTNVDFAGSTSAAFSQEIADFSVSDSPSALTVARGHAGSTTLTVAPVAGFTGSVALVCNGGTSKITCAVSPASVTINGSSEAATVTVTVASGAPTGAHTLTLQGTSGGVSHSVSLALTVD